MVFFKRHTEYLRIGHFVIRSFYSIFCPKNIIYTHKGGRKDPLSIEKNPAYSFLALDSCLNFSPNSTKIRLGNRAKISCWPENSPFIGYANKRSVHYPLEGHLISKTGKKCWQT